MGMNEIKMNFTVPKIDDNKDNSAFEEIQFVGVEEREKVEEIVTKIKEEARSAPSDISRVGSSSGKPNFRGGNDRGQNRNQGRFNDRRDNRGGGGGDFQNRGGNFQRRDFNQAGRGNFDNRRGGFDRFQQNRNQPQRGGFKQGGQFGQGQFQSFGGAQQFQQNWADYGQQQQQQPQQQAYGGYAPQGNQSGWTPQQQLWAQQWQQYYQQQAASQRK